MDAFGVAHGLLALAHYFGVMADGPQLLFGVA